MLAGTPAAPLLLDKLTSTPPAGAADPSVTVPVAFACPPITEDGVIPKDEIVPAPGPAAFNVSPAVTVFADVAVIVALVVLPTAVVVTVNVPEVWPCGITRLAGTLAEALSLDRETSTPPAGAADPSVTVPVAFSCPPTTADGAIPKEEIVPAPAPEGLSVSPAATLFVDVAVIANDVVLPTADVVTGKFPDVCPCAITMLAGTLAAALLLERVTRTPPAPAADASVTVPVEFACPPITDEGARSSEAIVPAPGETDPAWIVSPALAEFADVAVMVASVVVPTADVVTLKFPDVCPCGITNVAGTPAAPLLLERFTSTPPAGADDASVTVPAALPCPPTTADGAMLNPAIVPCTGPVGSPVLLALRFNPALVLFAEVAVIVASVALTTALVWI